MADEKLTPGKQMEAERDALWEKLNEVPEPVKPVIKKDK